MIGSSLIPSRVLEARTGALSEEIEAALFEGRKTFEFYRGDSFQALVAPEEALQLSLIWRAGVMATWEPGHWDIRVAIGIGEVDHLAGRLSVSGGPAFRFSGGMMDELKKKYNQRIGFQTPSESWNRQLETQCILAEVAMQRWTEAGAAAIYYQLLYGEKQEQLAVRLGVAQPAVHKRLQTASWPAIRHWEGHYRQEAGERIKAGTW